MSVLEAQHRQQLRQRNRAFSIRHRRLPINFSNLDPIPWHYFGNIVPGRALSRQTVDWGRHNFMGQRVDNKLLFKKLSEILVVAGEISALNLHNRKLTEDLVALEARRQREHDALAALVRDLEARLSVNRAA